MAGRIIIIYYVLVALSKSFYGECFESCLHHPKVLIGTRNIRLPKNCDPCCIYLAIKIDHKPFLCWRCIVHIHPMSLSTYWLLSAVSDLETVSNFSDMIDLMISDDAAEVPTAEEIMSHPLLSNRLVLTLKFIEEISIKTVAERKEFFR